MLVDGFDQGKGRLPRDPALRSLSSLAAYDRPRCKIHGVWAFGFCISIFVMDDNQKHDSACLIECIALTLEIIVAECKKTGRALPSSLWVFADNSVREAKNTFCMKYLQQLASKFKFRLCGLLVLRKSHTHDILDQLWGVLARCLAREDKTFDPSDIVKII